MVRILLVEDNRADVLMVREALRTSPIPADVMIAYDGQEALQKLREFDFTPELIILDLNLPKYSGLSVLERYRDFGNTPIVVLSGSQNELDKQRALELGAREYVLKPVTFEEFVIAVQGIVDRWVGNSSAASAGLAT